MKIGIDISQLAFPGTGVASYTENLVKNLVKIDRNNEYILFGGSLRKQQPLWNFIHKVSGTGRVWPINPTMMDWLWNRLHIFPVELFVGKIDIFHSSDWVQPPTKAKKITTIHDLLVLKYPEYSHNKVQLRSDDVLNWSANIVATQKRRLKWAARESDLIIAVSQATKRDIVEILEIPEEKVRVIYEGIGKQYVEQRGESREERAEEIRRVKNKYKINKKYILAFGTGDLRKNTDRVRGAFTRLGNKDVELVLIGKQGLGYVSEEDMPGLYAGAEVFVYPSLYEGFGLPVLEAMSCGVPVITSNVSSLPEVGGEAASYVDPYNIEEIKKKIEENLKIDQRKREEIVNRGYKQAEKFSWEKVARETIKVYEELAG